MYREFFSFCTSFALLKTQCYRESEGGGGPCVRCPAGVGGGAEQVPRRDQASRPRQGVHRLHRGKRDQGRGHLQVGYLGKSIIL